MKALFFKYKIQLFICLVAFGLYANTLGHDYAWDDSIVITANERVQKGFEGIPELLFNYKSGAISDTYGYRPITLISYAVEIGLFGLNPSISHFNNVILYTLLCLLIYQFLLQLFPNKRWQFCLLVVLIYICHPLHTEVVANIKSRDEILAFIFGILALRYFLNYLTSKKGIFLFSTGIFLLFSFLSKESALAFVPLILLVALYKVDISLKRFFQYSFITLLFFTGIIGVWLFSQSETVLIDQSNELIAKGQFQEDNFLVNPVKTLPSRLRVAPYSLYLLMKYIISFLIPHPLLHDYSFNQIPRIKGPTPLLVLGAITSITYIVYFLFTLKKKTVFKFGSLFFLISVFGYLHLIVPGKDIYAERFMFVPSLGLAIALISFLDCFSKKIKMKRIGNRTIFISPLLIIFCFFTVQRNKAWANNRTLFETDLPLLQNCVRANFNYASYLEFHLNDDSVSNQERRQNLEQIISLYKNCISISNKSYKAYVNLGNLYMSMGETEKALPLFQEIALLNPQLAEPFFLLGKYYLTLDDYQNALIQFKQSKHNGWAKTATYYHIAICHIKLNHLQEAIEILKEGEKYQPTQYKYYDLLGDLSLFNQDTVNSIQYTKRALEINPKNETLDKKYKARMKFTQ